MTSRITLLMAVAAAALAIVPAALGEGRLAGSPEGNAVAYFYANERATLAAQPARVLQRGDDFLRVRPEIVLTPTVSASPGSDIEWAQLGVGFGLGIVLVAGLWLTIRMTKLRELPH